MKKIKEEDVQEVYRAGKKREGQTTDIVIQFTKKSTRDTLLKQREKIPGTTNPVARMYINEDLTEYRQKLLFDARKMVKSGKIKGAWSQHGNVMKLRKDDGPIAVKDYKELRTQEESEMPGYNNSDTSFGIGSHSYSMSDYDGFSM